MAIKSYPFTPNPEANKLLAQSGTALLIGLCLEQQVRSEKAMSGPWELQRRIGHLDAKKIAAMAPAKLDAAFRERPALHRFPGMMAKRVQALCAVIAREYNNDGANLWAGIADAPTLCERFLALPGFGKEKAASSVRLLAKFGKYKVSGWQRYSTDETLPWEYRNGARLS